MALEFPAEWRFDQDSSPMPPEAVAAMVGIIDQIAASAPSPYWVFETVKTRFGDNTSSSSADWARSDMDRAMSSFERRAPLFVEAFWLALEDFREKKQLQTPTLEQVNALLAKHGVGFVIDPPHLRRTVALSGATAESAGPTSSAAYVLGDRIGGGGYGEVFKASRDAGVATFTFAVKVHDPSPFKSAEKALKRFSREVQALQKLQHRGLVTYVDAGVNEKQQPFLVMPYIEGSNLRDATSPDEPLVAVGYLIEVVTALVYAHSNNVLHRDLKPPNILVRSSDNQPVIVDFGLAYVFEDATKESLSSAAPGSAGYMPPEVLVNPKERSPLHDIYSVGVILYELLARKLPEDPRSTEPLAKIAPMFKAVDEVVFKAMAPAKERFQTAADLLKALKGLRLRLREPD